VPFVYWLTVVVLSVSGTLYTDILTDNLGVSLVVSTTTFAVILAVTFGVWFARERTLSIHSIVNPSRELFYWLAVLVTFALGTASGDWVLQLTGWGPGISVLLPAGLIGAIVVGWRLGANAVLSFWLAYILTRPLGANLGDWLASPATDHGLGLGTASTSVIFLAAILATVSYLTATRRDVIPSSADTAPTASPDPTRERIMLGYYAIVVAGISALLVWAGGQPHALPIGEAEEEGATPVSADVLPGQVAARFPAGEIAKLRSITQSALVGVQAGDRTAATDKATDLETAWDSDESALKPMDQTSWNALDSRIDNVLKAIRANNPNADTEKQALNALLVALR
jgi:uncharacterized membrane-anchored protein